MVIITIRTTVGREKTVIDSLIGKIKSRGIGIKSIVSPSELKGYIFIEGTEEDIIKVVQGITHIRGLIKKPVSPESLTRFFAEQSKEITIKEGDLVEVMGGPFKREKAKVVRVDEAKREAKIELVESVVPIPITIKLDLLKAIKS